MRKWSLLVLLLLLGIGIGYGVWLRSVHRGEQRIDPDSLAHLPDYVQNAASEVQTAYQFAVEHPEILQQIPCYCGCEKGLGHKHNLACYITAFNPDGRVAQYSDHAAY